jgi:chorismate mutase/prephenate dehydratase
MTDLSKLRKEIDEVDRKLLPLFERRMRLSLEVAEFKRVSGLAVTDSAREAEIVRERVSALSDSRFSRAAAELWEKLFALSREAQRQSLGEGRSDPPLSALEESIKNASPAPVKNPVVAYQGLPGSYSDEAVLQYFGKDGARRCADTFSKVMALLKNKEADYAVLPIETSSTGSITPVLDLLAKDGAYITGETHVRVNHCLMAPKGATLGTIREVYSHEQGFSQSQRFFEEHSGWRLIPYYNTAISAKFVAESGDVSKAAVASCHAARLYNLEILAENINSSDINDTRFAILGRRLEILPESDRIGILFTLAHESGTLHRMLSVFARHNLNLLRIESRPLEGKTGSICFSLISSAISGATGSKNHSRADAGIAVLPHSGELPHERRKGISENSASLPGPREKIRRAAAKKAAAAAARRPGPAAHGASSYGKHAEGAAGRGPADQKRGRRLCREHRSHRNARRRQVGPGPRGCERAPDGSLRS